MIKLPIIEHFKELRQRLLIWLVCFIILLIPFYFFSTKIFNFLLYPYQSAVGKYEVANLYFAPLEFFITKLKLTLYLSFITNLPVLFWQIYSFVIPALYQKEKKAFMTSILIFPILFSLGMAFVFWIIMPILMKFAIGMEVNIDQVNLLDISVFIKVGEYLSLLTGLMMVFGMVFQLPVILWILVKVGLVNEKQLKSARKYVLFIIFIIAAFFTPPDPFSQILLGSVLYILYEFSIIAVKFSGIKKDA